MKVEGKTVLITGTSSGIGYEAALLLAQEGWIVFAGVRSDTDLERLREQHLNIRPLMLDVTKPDNISRAVETIDVAVGDAGLDALVNNAGAAHSGPFEFVPLLEFEAEFRVNLFGVYGLTQALLPLLRRGSPGRIINVSSVLGTATLPYSSAYCATKYALESLTISMRQELRPMGPVLTKFTEKFHQQYGKVKDANAQNETFLTLYAERMKKSQKLHATLEERLAVAPVVVARQIQRMLKTRWLRHRYCDTYTTWFTTLMWAWLPSWLTDCMFETLIQRT